jgi:hypothetical protein
MRNQDFDLRTVINLQRIGETIGQKPVQSLCSRIIRGLLPVLPSDI